MSSHFSMMMDSWKARPVANCSQMGLLKLCKTILHLVFASASIRTDKGWFAMSVYAVSLTAQI